MEADWVIVGAGFSGAVLAERIANVLNEKVCIIDRRNHIGGNAYDYYDQQGVLIHKYGPHLFHTNSQEVWDYLSKFTSWHHYEHRVLVDINGIKGPIPFNFQSLRSFFPKKDALQLQYILLDHYQLGDQVPILKLMEHIDTKIKELATYIYRNVFYGYTFKQWGIPPEELDKSVTGRVPIRIGNDNRYFLDRFQAMPKYGYTRLFENMLDHPNIKVMLNTDYTDVKGKLNEQRLVYTGPIDQYFNYKFGKLDYRSLNFSFEHFPVKQYQQVGQINYPNLKYPFTRITEYKHFTGQNLKGTTISKEYPQPYIIGKNEPYYPVSNKENKNKLKRYKEEANKLRDQVLFLGRLGDFKYYNMDQVVARALSVFKHIQEGKG